MSKLLLKSILLFAAIVFVNQVSAQSLKLPYSDAGACPFEGCQYGNWTARKPTVVYKEMRNGSRVAFKIGNKEKVKAMTGIVITSKLGTAKTLKTVVIEPNNGKRTVKLKAGETLSLVHYEGEGFYTAWRNGEFYSVEIGSIDFKMIREPETVWWVKIRNRKGQIGWTRFADNFDGKDRYA